MSTLQSDPAVAAHPERRRLGHGCTGPCPAPVRSMAAVISSRSS
jgi:hypothetical protein